MPLTFDEASHTYTHNGVVVPSVTQILAPLYDFSMVPEDVLERKKIIGTAVHAAIEISLTAEGLDPASIDPVWEGYYRAWEKFLADTGISRDDIGPGENPLFHSAFGFAGKPDRVIHIDRKWAVVDYKTAVVLHPAIGLQLAAYREMLNHKSNKGEHKVEDRYALQLRKNGTYRLEKFSDKTDWATFLALLTINQWRKKHD